MCALTPMFPNKQQQWYSPSTMEYPWLSQVDSFSPTLHDLPSFLYPLDDSKSFNNINLHNHHHHMSLSHSYGTNSNNDNQEEDQGPVLEKKLNHNASERDRRRKLNVLYSSLRALMPPSDQKRKLSIPMTVARVVKYIPEQRQELQRLSKTKEELLKRKTMTLDLHHHQHQEEMRNKAIMDSMSQQISVNWLSDTEIALQIATSKWTSISEMMLRLEENGFNVISVSSSVSSTARVFYTMHLEMRGDCRVRLEDLNSMLFRSKFHQGVNIFS